MKKLLALGIFVLFGFMNKPIIDSEMTFEDAVKGTKAPANFIDSMEIINVEYIGFDGKLRIGQLVVNKLVSQDIKDAFKLMLDEKFPVEKVIPIVKYGWDDNRSMEDNNTSAFNYRNVANTNRLSNHSWGRAIDINPFQNPAVYNDGSVAPKGAVYDVKKKGTIAANSKLVEFFKSRGWRWGGDWTSLKDYQHFDKP